MNKGGIGFHLIETGIVTQDRIKVPLINGGKARKEVTGRIGVMVIDEDAHQFVVDMPLLFILIEAI